MSITGHDIASIQIHEKTEEYSHHPEPKSWLLFLDPLSPCFSVLADGQGFAIPLFEALKQRVDVLALVDGHEHLVKLLAG